MLTISKPISSGQAQTYHAKEFTSAEQNYWKQGDTILGEWQGQLAEKYGLAGAIDAQHFARLSEGQNPLTGEQLVKHRKAQEYTTADGTTVKPVEHRAGWDATFSAPKSVSLTALVGGDDRVRSAHREAVTIALTELERYTQARIGGNNPAETTGKFIAAKFEHDTARPVDGYAAPQLHTHAVIFNMTERPDGSTRAIQPQSYFDSQQIATAVYQSELTFRLRNLGYQIEAGKSGAPDIKGYTPEYLEASSPRRQQIEEAVARSGFSGPEAAQIAAHNTRDKKDILSSSEVLAAHRKIANEFGNQADRVVAEARERAATLQQNQMPDSRVRAQEAVSFAKDRGFEREAVTDERAIMRDALRRGMGDLTYSQVRDNFDQRHGSGEFKIAPGQKHETGRQFTTRETIAAELATIGHMQRGQNTIEPIMPKQAATAHATTREFLNPAQRRAIEEVLTSRDRVHGLQGLAGTGKTTTLEAIREGAERSGYAVEGFAPTSRAAAQLRDAGLTAGTLQGFLTRGRQEQSSGDPNSRHLYMVDESSLASTRQMQAFMEKIGPQDRVLLIGDTRQHQSVDAGKPFEQMQQAGMQTSQLDQIMRQKDPELLRAVEHLSKNETAIGLTLLQQQGRVTEIPDNAQRIEAIAKDYVAKPENTLVVSPDNASRQEINNAIRTELQASGVVSVAVGIQISPYPPHRSGLADFPHTAPTSGNDAHTAQRKRMIHAHRRKPVVDQAQHPIPRYSAVLAAARQRPMPEPAYLESERTQRVAVHGHSVVADVSTHHRPQPLACVLDGRVHSLSQLGFYRVQLRLLPLANCLPYHRKVTVAPLLPADMREAEKVERLRLPYSAPLSVSDRERSELQKPRFVGMQFQAELPKPLSKFCQELPGIRFTLEPNHDVVRVSHDDYIAMRLLATPCLSPQIED